MGKKSKKDQPSLSARLGHVEKYAAKYPHRVRQHCGKEINPRPEEMSVEKFGQFACVPLKEYGRREWFFDTETAARLFAKLFPGAVAV